MIVVGKGILGLANAEYFSRSAVRSELGLENIVVVSCNSQRSPGSAAAAANLATKGQLFARDPHFALKLEGKKTYRSWLQSLLSECNSDLKHESFNNNLQVDLNSIFRAGVGRDYFASEHDAAKQYERVFQGAEELKARGFLNNTIYRKTPTTLNYLNEAWVDASALLALLEAVCRGRGVQFLEKNICHEDHLKEIILECGFKAAETQLLLCPGAGILELLETLGMHRPPELRRSLRMSLGSIVVYSDSRFAPLNVAPSQFNAGSGANVLFDCEKDVLLEDVSSNFESKVTLSGGARELIASSTTVKIEPARVTSENVQSAQMPLTQDAESAVEKAVSALDTQAREFARRLGKSEPLGKAEVRTGVRVGFGHQEIVITKLIEKWNTCCVSLCVGAHKSGFLFAPVVGEQMHKLHSQAAFKKAIL